MTLNARKTTATPALPPSVNYHLNVACNYACKFCYARFEDSKAFMRAGMLPNAQQLAVVDMLAEAGFEKITFAGGEPTLVPWLDQLISRAKTRGMTTMLVTNGSRLSPAFFDTCGDALDWLILSVDSFDSAINRAIGRAQKQITASPEHYIAMATLAHERHIRLKVNTVVNRLNLAETLIEPIRVMRPERWKLFQVLPIEGQNDGDVDALLISDEEFQTFVQRHQPIQNLGVPLVPENNAAMTSSYAMIDPAGRFFDNSLGCYTYSQPILEVGVEHAFGQIHFDHQIYQERGAVYDW